MTGVDDIGTVGPGKWLRIVLVGGCALSSALLFPDGVVRAAEPAPPSAASAPAPAADAGVTDAPDAAPPVAQISDADAGAPPPGSADGADAGSTTEATAEAPAAAEAESSGGGLFESSASGSSGGGGADESGGERPVEIGGAVRGDVFIGKVDGRPRGEMKAAFGELALEARSRKGTYGDAFAEARLRYGLQGKVKELVVDLREAYVNAYMGPLDLRLGQQIVVWGRADAFNPTNNVTPFDMRVRSPVEDDRRVGNVGARAFLTFAPFRLEGVWMPLYRPAELPIIVPDYVQFDKTNFPKPKLKNGLGAGRLHLELASFEASASFLHGFAPVPGLTLHALPHLTWPPVDVARTAYRHHVVGGDFSTAIGEELGVRGEVAYRHPVRFAERPYTPRPDLQYALGVDRAFGSVTVILQYLGRTTFHWTKSVVQEPPPAASAIRPENLHTVSELDWGRFGNEIRAVVESEIAVRNQMLFSQLHKVQHLLTARAEWLTLHDTLTLTALGMVNVSTKEWLAFPRVAYRLSDEVSATVGGEIYMGPRDTLFGVIDQQLSAGYAELRYDF